MTVYATPELRVTDLGRRPYARALAVQRGVNEAVSLRQAPATLLLVEHDPVITITPRKGVQANLLASAGRLAELGIDVQPTDRGGDITYHGPGQLVAYPILRMNEFGLNLGRYMRLLEQVVIDTVARFGVAAHREEGATGVWVGGQGSGIGNQGSGGRDQGSGVRGQGSGKASSLTPDSCLLTPDPAKLCAMGVRVRKNTTMHGLALNVSTDLSHFQTIVPCGLAGRPVTSLALLLGERCPSMDAVKAALVETFDHALAECRVARA